MPKLKSCKSATKRYKKIGLKKFKRKKSFKSHILVRKRPKRKRRLSKNPLIQKSDIKIFWKKILIKK